MTNGEVPPRDDDLDMPWLATGRLDAAQAARLDALLAGDPEAVRRLELARDERAETVALNEALGAPSPRVRDALFARIAAAAPRSAPAPGLGARLTGWLSGLAPRTLATAALAALAVIVVQGALLTDALRHGGEGPRYTTASAEATCGTRLLAGFAPQATAAEIVALLSGARATVASGPRPGGIFELCVADHPLTEQDIGKVIDGLKGSGIVAFVAREGDG